VPATALPVTGARRTGRGLDAPLAIPLAGGRLHPLFARYYAGPAARAPRCARPAGPRSTSAHGSRPGVLGEHELRAFGDPARLLFNVNTPADLERAEAMLAAES